MKGVVKVRHVRPLASDEPPQGGMALSAPDSPGSRQRAFARLEIVQEEAYDLVTVSFEEADLGPNGFVLSPGLAVVIVDDEDLHAATARFRHSAMQGTEYCWPNLSMLL
jgi:hypothetical protein